MSFLRPLLRSPLLHLALLELAVAIVFLRSTIVPMDDHAHYQKFIEALATGRVDLSIPGFHGASFLALPLYLVTGSPLTNIHFQILCALLILPAAFLAAKAILRDTVSAILFVYAVALMPFLFFLSLRGFTFPSFTLMVLLTLWLRGTGSRFAWIPFSISLLIKPFSFALLPLFIFWEPERHSGGTSRKAFLHSGKIQFLLAMLLPAIYVLVEYLQIGRIIVGAHENISQSNVFQWWRLPLNAAHGIQMLFSVHNFYFVEPARTGLANMTHSSPMLLFSGVVSLLYPKEFWPADRRLAQTLLLSAALAFALAAALDHMDHFYMETCVLLLTIAGIPFIMKYRLILPLILATLHFQFFYMYLAYNRTFFPDYSLFVIPLVVDMMAVSVWLIYSLPALGVFKRRQ